MNQAELHLLMSRLRVKVKPRGEHWPKSLRSHEEARGALLKTRKLVTRLIVDERSELDKREGVVVRQYAERLISDALLHGDKHQRTMNMAHWWLEEWPAAVHKLFKVLVPRFRESNLSFTRMFNAPVIYDPVNDQRIVRDRVVLELRNNQLPRLAYSNTRPNRMHLHNVLLNEARKEFEIALNRSKNSKSVENAVESCNLGYNTGIADRFNNSDDFSGSNDVHQNQDERGDRSQDERSGGSDKSLESK